MNSSEAQKRFCKPSHRLSTTYTAFHVKLPFWELDYTACAKCGLLAFGTIQWIIKLQKMNI
jgi:hypothetical protein